MPASSAAGDARGASPADYETLLHLVGFDELSGWAEDDHAAAFAAFQASAGLIADTPPKTRALGIRGEDLHAVARQALRAGQLSRSDAQHFFQTWFRPCRIVAAGFATGYYEPEVEARRQPDGRFRVPLYRRPPDLVELSRGEAGPGANPEMRYGRRTGSGILPYFTRAEIEAGALSGLGLELAWVESEVEAYFIHVQGSGRLRLPEGELIRIGFDGKSGHPYTSIGQLAVERGLLPREGADKQGLEAWLRENPQAGGSLMRENRSFIFFREVVGLENDEGPLGAAGVPLHAGRSLAVDRQLMTFHTPVWVASAELVQDGGAFRRLMVAHDTGSAIVGPARGDIFFGCGEEAGIRAGRVRHGAEMAVLVPQRAGRPPP